MGKLSNWNFIFDLPKGIKKAGLYFERDHTFDVLIYFIKNCICYHELAIV
ncbi:hypothetical protein Niako_1771 [Niastella koreensis GR20-10]|uniref:Uncharacterized protein n=1 Tax=Niastella koreensis (strain DSM 17620 / KACC 11465 / NBRC 106392 / GR20-10) TaxID=700598 RepID=G8TAH2_NIAKG|nr:hypothetical protein Niako_1771 [Niastella koreensis GR20-10]